MVNNQNGDWGLGRHDDEDHEEVVEGRNLYAPEQGLGGTVGIERG